MLCYFLVYSKVIQLCIHIYSFFFRFFSHRGYYRIWVEFPVWYTIGPCWLFILYIVVHILEKAMAPHSSTLAWKIPWTEEPVGCSPWDCEESDMTEQLHFHFSLSCSREGNGNPLQCSCLENPRDGGAWWAAVYGVAQSRTQLKRFSSSSSSTYMLISKS